MIAVVKRYRRFQAILNPVVELKLDSGMVGLFVFLLILAVAAKTKTSTVQLCLQLWALKKGTVRWFSLENDNAFQWSFKIKKQIVLFENFKNANNHIATFATCMAKSCSGFCTSTTQLSFPGKTFQIKTEIQYH